MIRTAPQDPAFTVEVDEVVRTARTTGVLYLVLGVTGMLGFLLVRQELFSSDDAAATLANLMESQGLARVGIAFELGVVLSQALAALWFFRLFRPVDAFAAGAIAAFGLVNAVAILVSAACLATALQVALEPVGEPGNAQLMYLVSDNLWTVGGLFFGLWLVPMGWCVLRSGWMPRPLGWILVVGGGGYVLGAFVHYLAPDAQLLADLMVIPATIGELWMIGYLLLRGVDRSALV